jgi:hypothetical protein
MKLKMREVKKQQVDRASKVWVRVEERVPFVFSNRKNKVSLTRAAIWRRRNLVGVERSAKGGLHCEPHTACP